MCHEGYYMHLSMWVQEKIPEKYVGGVQASA